MENQLLKAINHIKYISKKKPCTLKIFNYLQNNYASNYDYHSVEDKLNELKSNGIIDDSCKIINLLQEVMNFATEDEVIIYSENSEDELTIHIEPLHPLRLIHLKLLPQL